MRDELTRRQALDELSERVGEYAPRDGNFDWDELGVTLLRRSAPTDAIRGWQPVSVCVVARGAKRLTLGTQTWDCDEAQVLVCSLDVPVLSQVRRASDDHPFLCVRVRLDPARVSALLTKVLPDGPPRDQANPALGVAVADARLVRSVCRLVEALSSPHETALYAPLAYEEVLLRLLEGPAGPVVARVSLVESGLAGVARAVTWLRQHYAQPLKMTDLASMANMSVSSFHEHFKGVTNLSPLQYLKAIRLQEARNLMLTKTMGAKSASQSVGYSSPSQFSREYSRYFGRAPLADTQRVRERWTDQALPGRRS